MSAEISFFAEHKGSGYWRLQTNELTLVRVMNERSRHPKSPWNIAGRGQRASDPMIYRRKFSSSTKARQWLERILIRMDTKSYDLCPVAVGFGWFVCRPSEEIKTSRIDSQLSCGAETPRFQQDAKQEGNQ